MRRRNVYVALLVAYAVSNMPKLGPVYDLALVLRWPLLVLGVLIAIGQQRQHGTRNVVTWLGVFGGLAGASVVWSTDRITTAFIFLVGVAFVFALDGLLARGRLGTVELVGMLAALHVAVVLASLVFYVVQPGSAVDSSNFKGIIGNSNGLGVLLALTAPAVWAWEPFRRRLPLLFATTCLVGPSLILASRSRSALLGLVAAGLVSMTRTRLRTKVVLGYVVVLCAVLGLALGHAAVAKHWFVDDLLYKDQRNGDVLSSRRTAFTLTWESAQRHIVIGRGFGVIASPAVLRAEGVNLASTRSSHREVGNAYLGLLEQVGLVGSVLFAGMVIGILGAVHHVLRGRERASTALAAVIVGSLVAANFEAYLFATGAIEALITWSAVVVVVRSRTRVEVSV